MPVTRTDEPALRHIQAQGVDWMHACGAKGRCTTCRMIVLKGSEKIGPHTAAELKYQKAGLLLQNERLACQALVIGDIVVRVPEDSKLPHLKYTS